MFKCDDCGCFAQPHEKLTRRVDLTRDVTYKDGNVGTEIVKESNLCPKCALKAGITKDGK